MPWKVFTQSLALTNFGNKLANDQFIQRQKCLLLPKYSPKVGLFGLWTILLPSGAPFRGHTRKVGACNPSTPCDGLQSMLYLCAVSGLVISRMEDILEHGCLDIVAFLPFLERDGFNFLANLVLVHLLFGEVSPSPFSIWTLNRYFPLILFDRYCRLDFCRCLVGDLQGMLIRHVQIKSRKLSLYAIGDELNAVNK